MHIPRALIGFAIITSIFGVLLGTIHPGHHPGPPHPIPRTPPTIISFSPTSGPVATTVTIIGTNFSTAIGVQLNGRSVGNFTVISGTQISFNVAWSATSGPITVINPDGSNTSTSSFAVTLGIVASVSAPPPGGALAINGTAFDANEAVDIYFDTTDTKLALTNGNGDFSVSVAVPLAATPGTHYFTAVGRRSQLAAQCSVTVRTNWGQLQSGPLHQSVNPLENVISPANAAALQQDWAFASASAGTASPVISGGMAFIGTSSGGMNAVNATTGATVWTSTTGGAITSAAAASSSTNIVYVGAGDGKLYAFSSVSGAQLWTFTTGAGIVSAPTFSGANVYFGSQDNKVYALNASTGALVWSYTTGAPVQSSPAVANGILYIGSNDANLYALNASTGSLVWSYTTGAAIHSSPAVANGTVYVGSEDHSVYAISTALGTKTWSYATGAAVDASPGVANGIVYIGSADDSLYALNAANGSVVWHVATGAALTTAPGIANGVLVVGSEDHNLYVLATSTGAVLLTIHTDNPLDSSAAIANGVVYIVAGNTNGLVAYDLNASVTPSSEMRPNPKHLHPNRRLKPTPPPAA